jgi:N-acetyltransferase
MKAESRKHPIPFAVSPVTLKGEVVTLEPMDRSHVDELRAIATDPAIWTWYVERFLTPEDVTRMVEEALAGRDRGQEVPFVIRENASGQLVGSTRYLNISPLRPGVEIGWTWIAPRWQRTAVNTEAKYLLLRHAFQALGCIRVELLTDSLNEPSRRAIQRIGAQEEGIRRNHWVTWSGRIRHSAVYSIIDSEWPAVEARLRAKLGPRR